MKHQWLLLLFVTTLIVSVHSSVDAEVEYTGKDTGWDTSTKVELRRIDHTFCARIQPATMLAQFLPRQHAELFESSENQND